MQKKEAKSSLLFRHWIMANPQMSASYEMKDTRGKPTFPLAEFKEPQENFAEAIRYGKKGVLIRTEGVTGLPDYVYLKNAPSFVVIKYPKHLIIISGETISMEKKVAKSLSLKRAIELSHHTIEL